MGHTGGIAGARTWTQAKTKLFITTLYCLPGKALSVPFRFNECLHSVGAEKVFIDRSREFSCLGYSPLSLLSRKSFLLICCLSFPHLFLKICKFLFLSLSYTKDSIPYIPFCSLLFSLNCIFRRWCHIRTWRFYSSFLNSERERRERGTSKQMCIYIYVAYKYASISETKHVHM